VAHDASTLYARNVLAVLLHLAKGGQMDMDVTDEIVSAMLLTHDGEVRHAPTAELLQAVPA
jgi:NAD(P) transhydrogenase subunit alpha